MHDVMAALAEYVNTLETCLERTHQAEDRTMYLRHLAAAAQMFAAAQRSDVRKLEALLSEEKRQFGWSFLTGDGGQQAEAAFVELERELRRTVMK
jgi:hypothetical protein